MTAQDVAVVIGVGGMGRAIARRVGSGKTLALADFDDVALEAVTRELADDGHAVVPTRLDVGDIEAVHAFADSAAALGPVVHVAHTAGLSPVQASGEQIIRVDLVGVAAVLDAFGARIAHGATGAVITSMAGHLWPPFADDVARGLATVPADELYDFNLAHNDFARHPTTAYATAKAANILRVRAAAASWGRRRGRVNSISPGVIATPMGRAELSSENGAAMADLIDAAALNRTGTPDEIAAVAGARGLGPVDAVANVLRVSGAGFTYQMIAPVTVSGNSMTATLQMSLVGQGSRTRALTWVWAGDKWKLSNRSTCDVAGLALIPCSL